MSLAAIDDRMDFLFPGMECGLWYGATERRWEFEPLAVRRYFRRFGYRTDCGCKPWDWMERAPSHLDLKFVSNPRDPVECAARGDRRPDRSPLVRYAGQSRDGFGRFATRRGYVWRSDFDEYMDWYERHLAEMAVECLRRRDDEGACSAV